MRNIIQRRTTNKKKKNNKNNKKKKKKKRKKTKTPKHITTNEQLHTHITCRRRATHDAEEHDE